MSSFIWHGLIVLWGCGMVGGLMTIADQLKKIVTLLGGDPEIEGSGKKREELKT